MIYRHFGTLSQSGAISKSLRVKLKQLETCVSYRICRGDWSRMRVAVFLADAELIVLYRFPHNRRI